VPSFTLELGLAANEFPLLSLYLLSRGFFTPLPLLTVTTLYAFCFSSGFLGKFLCYCEFSDCELLEVLVRSPVPSFISLCKAACLAPFLYVSLLFSPLYSFFDWVKLLTLFLLELFPLIEGR